MKNIKKICLSSLLLVTLISLSSCNNGTNSHYMRSRKSLCCKPWKLLTTIAISLSGSVDAQNWVANGMAINMMRDDFAKTISQINNRISKIKNDKLEQEVKNKMDDYNTRLLDLENRFRYLEKTCKNNVKDLQTQINDLNNKFLELEKKYDSNKKDL